MRIHTYEKLWLAGSFVLIVGFIVTVTYGSVGLGIDMIGEEADGVSPDEISSDERFSEPRVEQVGENEYEVYVVAMTFIFQPDPIEVPANSEVTFYVTSRDVIHGFEVPGTNINSMAIPGQVAELTVEFDEPGTYGVICNEYCGPQHHTMEGSLVVTPEWEFSQTELEVDAPESVAQGDEIDLTATVSNGLLETHESTVNVTIGSQTTEQSITVDGESSENVSVTVDSDELGPGEHDWTVSVDDQEESGTITVGNETDTTESVPASVGTETVSVTMNPADPTRASRGVGYP
ncbi:cytochrome c oxidase subunit II [Halovivax asiaticus JCM 14624]|uniref:Cytochrome c oxidase subunit II n=1 Tax=Halovivax asiaticus JCM 14624 TaxID=1227490 RepID=M0BRM9_9EURY|nr:cytochrome c oxidase subunit II [Halovivax asiaticus]ELZ13580.1 cytochrome c oxidase subunit II [Halovivax asiaticus JCM 14624]